MYVHFCVTVGLIHTAVYICLSEHQCLCGSTCKCRSLHSCKNTPLLSSLHLCVAASLVFQHQLWQQSCHRRKQNIIKVSECSCDNTKGQHWHINTVSGHNAITVYRPAPAQLPPLQSSIITTRSNVESVTPSLFFHRECTITLQWGDPSPRHLCLFTLNKTAVATNVWIRKERTLSSQKRCNVLKLHH